MASVEGRNVCTITMLSSILAVLFAIKREQVLSNPDLFKKDLLYSIQSNPDLLYCIVISVLSNLSWLPRYLKFEMSKMKLLSTF